MPEGLSDLKEAQLHKAPRLVSPQLGTTLGKWWLPSGGEHSRTPNFDIASTCTIDGAPGLMLVEAKAHAKELTEAAVGRMLTATDATERHKSHETISVAIESARIGLAAATGLAWHISRDKHYQMSNRFAWSWKLATLGIPVVLVYLGFLNARDMSKPGEVPFDNHNTWETLVMKYSTPLFPGEVWNRPLLVQGVPLIPLIRSIEQPLEAQHM